MVIKIKKGFLAFLAVVFAAVLCAVGAFRLSAHNSAFAEESAEEVAVASVTFGDKTTSYTTVRAAFEQANKYGTTAESPAVITLIADREAEENLQITVESGKFLTLDLNGHMLKLTGTNDKAPISVGGTFMLRDRQPNAEHKYNIGEKGLYVFDENGTQTIRGGVITGGDVNTGNVDGGCVNVSGNNASFIMTGGNIAGNKVQGNGGAISVNKNTFLMEGGAIAGNVSVGGNGGGVYLSSGTFTMTGGEIENNYCGKLGGGVYANSTFVMQGGTISGNSSGRHGGGIYNSGSFTLKGGSISGNSTTDDKRYGGGVFNMGTFTVSGAPVITGNSKPAGSGNSAPNNLYLENSTAINVDGLLETTDPAASAQINLTVNGTLSIAGYTESGNTGSPSKYFAFDSGKCIQLGADGTLNAEQTSHTVDESVWKHDTVGHWNECSVCGAKVNYEAHRGNAASCTTEGQCDVCQANYGPNGHKFVHHAAVAATCTAKGYKEYWYCSVCDKNYADGEATSNNEFTGEITTPIDGENHNKATAWTNGGAEGHYHVCENGCGEKLDLTAHDTAGTDGACSYCEYKTSETHTHDFSGEYVKNATQHWKVCKDCAEEDTKTAHVYDKEIVDAKYLKSAADCSEAAVYYKSCVCGQKGTETFNSGSANGQHDITSIVITTQPNKKSYTALETFNTAGMVVKTHCSNCNQDIEEVEAKDSPSFIIRPTSACMPTTTALI